VKSRSNRRVQGGPACYLSSKSLNDRIHTFTSSGANNSARDNHEQQLSLTFRNSFFAPRKRRDSFFFVLELVPRKHKGVSLSFLFLSRLVELDPLVSRNSSTLRQGRSLRHNIFQMEKNYANDLWLLLSSEVGPLHRTLIMLISGTVGATLVIVWMIVSFNFFLLFASVVMRGQFQAL